MSSYTEYQSDIIDLTTIPEERSQDLTYSNKTGVVSRHALRPAHYGSLSDGMRSLRRSSAIPTAYTGPAVPDSGPGGEMRLPRYPQPDPSTTSVAETPTDPSSIGRRRSLYSSRTPPANRTTRPPLTGGNSWPPVPDYSMWSGDEKFETKLKGGSSPPPIKFLVDEQDPDRKRLDIFDDGSTPVSTFSPAQRAKATGVQAAIYRAQQKEMRRRLKKEREAARGNEVRKSHCCTGRCVFISILVLFLIIGAALAISLGLYFGLSQSKDSSSTQNPRNDTMDRTTSPGRVQEPVFVSMDGALRLRDYEFISSYSNLTSDQSTSMSQKISSAFFQVMISLSSEQPSSKLQNCFVNGFRNGSVIADFTLVIKVYRSDDDYPDNDDEALLEDVKRIILYDLNSDDESSVFQNKFKQTGDITLETLTLTATMTTAQDDVTNDVTEDFNQTDNNTADDVTDVVNINSSVTSLPARDSSTISIRTTRTTKTTSINRNSTLLASSMTSFIKSSVAQSTAGGPGAPSQAQSPSNTNPTTQRLTRASTLPQGPPTISSTMDNNNTEDSQTPITKFTTRGLTINGDGDQSSGSNISRPPTPGFTFNFTKISTNPLILSSITDSDDTNRTTIAS